MSFGHYYKYFEKTPQNSTLKTPPQVNKRGSDCLLSSTTA